MADPLVAACGGSTEALSNDGHRLAGMVSLADVARALTESRIGELLTALPSDD